MCLQSDCAIHIKYSCEKMWKGSKMINYTWFEDYCNPKLIMSQPKGEQLGFFFRLLHAKRPLKQISERPKWYMPSMPPPDIHKQPDGFYTENEAYHHREQQWITHIGALKLFEKLPASWINIASWQKNEQLQQTYTKIYKNIQWRLDEIGATYMSHTESSVAFLSKRRGQRHQGTFSKGSPPLPQDLKLQMISFNDGLDSGGYFS